MKKLKAVEVPMLLSSDDISEIWARSCGIDTRWLIIWMNERLHRERELCFAAKEMTAIVMNALDEFSPKERAKMVKAYLGKNTKDKKP